MEASILKSLRVKQIIYMNVCLFVFIPLTACLILVFEPSISDVYLGVVFLYAVLLLSEFWSFFFRKHLPFTRGPRFMQEIAEYERKKIGKKQDRKGQIGRLLALTFSFGIHVVAFFLIRSDDSMHIRNVPGYWTLMAIIVIIFALVVNAAILNRIYRIDKTKPGQFRWFTLQSVLLGVALGIVALFLLNVGFWIALK